MPLHLTSPLTVSAVTRPGTPRPRPAKLPARRDLLPNSLLAGRCPRRTVGGRSDGCLVKAVPAIALEAAGGNLLFALRARFGPRLSGRGLARFNAGGLAIGAGHGIGTGYGALRVHAHSRIRSLAADRTQATRRIRGCDHGFPFTHVDPSFQLGRTHLAAADASRTNCVVSAAPPPRHTAFRSLSTSREFRRIVACAKLATCPAPIHEERLVTNETGQRSARMEERSLLWCRAAT